MTYSDQKGHPLQHFLDAQDELVSSSKNPNQYQPKYDRVLEQLKTGVLPTDHEMWYIFPRVVEPHGAEAQKRHAKRYSIKSYSEAFDYYNEPDLYNNLVTAIDVIRSLSEKAGYDEIFGRAAKKFSSLFKDSLTLFAEIEVDLSYPEDLTVFQDALRDFFRGKKSQATIDVLYAFRDHPDHPDFKLKFGGEDDKEILEEDDEEEDGVVDVKDQENLEIEQPMYSLKGFIASRVLDGELQYQADWIWHVPDLSFYPATNFRNASPLLEAFHDGDDDQPGPSVRLDEWLAAYYRGKIAKAHEDDNTPAVKPKKTTTAAARKPNKVTKSKTGKK